MALMKLGLPNLLWRRSKWGYFSSFVNFDCFRLDFSSDNHCCLWNGAKQPTNLPVISRTGDYALLARGNSAAGQDFGNWVVQTAKGLVQDAYVRDNNKLGVVITPQVRPNEVKPLAKSLAQGFHKIFRIRNSFDVCTWQKLILQALYDTQSKQISYK